MDDIISYDEQVRPVIVEKELLVAGGLAAKEHVSSSTASREKEDAGVKEDSTSGATLALPPWRVNSGASGSDYPPVLRKAAV